MADVNDVQNYARKFENQLAKVDTADIDERDRDAIHQWIRFLDADGDRNKGTIINLLNRIRLSAERSDVSLVDMDRQDVDSLLFDLKHDHDLAEGTRRNYRKALKQFHRWQGADWVEDFVIGVSPTRKVDPNDLLTDEEIQALIDAAENPRDKALVALLADTGLRIGAIASLRIRDLDMTGQVTLLSINEDANVKDASGTVPLTWSESQLTSYLDVHPRRDDPDAPVFHKQRGYIDEDGDDGALAYQYLSRRIKDVADEAGVDREKCHLHNFRHTAISNWIREGLTEQAIKHRASWDVDSDMIGVYSSVRDEELNDQILDHYDLDAGEDRASGHSIEQCPRCDTALRGTERFCPSCSAPLSASAAEDVEAVEDDTFESARNADGDDQDLLGEFRERFRSDPAFRARVVGEDHADSS